MYLLINNLGLYNTRWAKCFQQERPPITSLLPRTFFSGISDSLYDSARIDGAGEMKILWKVYMPLSKPVISVLILYYAIQQWNSYFNAMIYLPGRRDLQPLQIYLMKVLINNESAVDGGAMGSAAQSMISTQLKYVVIVVALVPILCVYPFLQKYFTRV